jgi:hypothetical protein
MVEPNQWSVTHQLKDVVVVFHLAFTV